MENNDLGVVANIWNNKWSFNLDDIKIPTYKQISEEIFNKIDNYINNKITMAASIYAPYRTGKTELLYSCFRKTLNSKKAISIYGNLEDIINFAKKNNFIDEESPKFEDTLKLISKKQIEIIYRIFISNDFSNLTPQDVFLPNFSDFISDFSVPEISKPRVNEYIEKISNECNIQIDDFKKIIDDQFRLVKKNRQKIVFLIDEFEVFWEKFHEIFSKQNISVLRGTFDKINQNDPPFYIVIAFGMSSIYELLRSDETGRVFLSSIPILESNDLIELEKDYKNYYWWISRGRIGWYKKIKLESKNLTDFDKIIETLSSGRIDQVPFLNFSEYQSAGSLMTILSDIKFQNFFKNKLLKLFPEKININNDLGRTVADFEFSGFYFSEKLISLKNLALALDNDLKRNNISFKDSNLILPKYFKLILEAIADKDKNISFGVISNEYNKPGRKDEIVKNEFIIPLYKIIRDLIIENESHEVISNIVDQINEFIDKVKDPSFTTSNLEQKIEEIYSINIEDLYCQFSLKTIHTLFPRPVYHPIIGVNGPKESRYLILNNLNTKVYPIIRNNPKINIDLKIFYYLIEEESHIDNYFESKFFKKIDVLYNRGNIHNFLISCDSNLYNSIINKINKNEKLKFLLSINKVFLYHFKQQNILDFIKSVFFESNNATTDSFNNWEQKIEYIKKEIFENENILKGEKKRKVDSFKYYKALTDSVLNDIAQKTFKEYKSKFLDVYSMGDENSVKKVCDTINRLFTSQAFRGVNVLQHFLLVYQDIAKSNSIELSYFDEFKKNWLSLKNIIGIGTKEGFSIEPEIDSKNIGLSIIAGNTFSMKRKKSLSLSQNLSIIREYLQVNERKIIQLKEISNQLNNKELNIMDFNEPVINEFIQKSYEESPFTALFLKQIASYNNLCQIIQILLKIEVSKIEDLKFQFNDEIKNLETKIINPFSKFIEESEMLNSYMNINNILPGFSYYDNCGRYKDFQKYLEDYKKFLLLISNSKNNAYRSMYYLLILFNKKIQNISEYITITLGQNLRLFRDALKSEFLDKIEAFNKKVEKITDRTESVDQINFINDMLKDQYSIDFSKMKFNLDLEFKNNIKGYLSEIKNLQYSSNHNKWYWFNKDRIIDPDLILDDENTLSNLISEVDELDNIIENKIKKLYNLIKIIKQKLEEIIN